MLTIICGMNCYCPQHAGKKDILISGEKIIKITEPGEMDYIKHAADEIDGEGLLAFPGIIDQHLHLIGGGGENGPASRIGEISFEEIVLAGITTVGGLLGLDCYTKSLYSLLAKVQTLEAFGLSTFLYTGSYAIPIVTFTGSIVKDLILVDKVIGIGEIAISDKRSSHIGMREFAELSSQVYTGGLVSGKPGIVHIHVGDGRSGLEPLLNLLQNTELPREIFVPTHINRNPKLFKKGIGFCRMGGNIDLTAGEKIGVSVPDALVELIKAIPNLDRVTVSSDANGSSAAGATTVQTLYEDIKTCILKYNIPPEVVFRPVTENVARVLKMYPKKGTLKEGSDADIIITDSQYNIQKLFSKGLLVVNDGKAIRK